MNYLCERFPKAEINIINLFPRYIKGQTDIANELNKYIKNYTLNNSRLSFVDTEKDYLFSNGNGKRRDIFFHDKVHFNNIGVIRFAKHLKFLSHNDL